MNHIGRVQLTFPYEDKNSALSTLTKRSTKRKHNKKEKSDDDDDDDGRVHPLCKINTDRRRLKRTNYNKLHSCRVMMKTAL